MEKQVLVVLLIVLSALTIASLVDVPMSFVELDGKRFSVSVADSSLERQRGLMFVDDLCVDCGMLFLFDEAKPLSFWMKNTKIPLDIIFFNEKKEVISIHHAKPCVEDPCAVYISGRDAKYVLEVNMNSFDSSILGKKMRVTL